MRCLLRQHNITITLFEDTYQGGIQTHLKDCSESSVSLLSQPLFSTIVRTGITRLHLLSFRLHLQAAQRGTWNLAQEQLQGHLLATRNLYTIV